jgi:hypothetical protein
MAGLLAAAGLGASLLVMGCGSSTPKESARVQINVPIDGGAIRSKRITVRGTVTPANASVRILGQPAQVQDNVFSSSVGLHPGVNHIDVVATGPDIDPMSTAITVIRRRARKTRIVAPPSGQGGQTAVSLDRFQSGQDPGEDFPATFCTSGSAELYCWTPNDGFTLSLPRDGSPSRVRADDGANRGFAPSEYPELPLGRTAVLGSFSCTNSRSGLTCRNPAGHGWSLPRYRGLPSYF